MATPARVTVGDQLRQIPPPVRATAQAARRAVKAAAPDAKEIAYQSARPRSRSMLWKIARYALRDQPVAGIGVFPEYAALYFYRGRELDDGSGELQGSGAKMRFIRLRTPADATRPEVKRLLRRAFAAESDGLEPKRGR